jgi:tRNA dimethylallyltransferase
MIVVIAGPTGVGKSKIAIELAKKLDAEIISADAFQVYKYMNIGTAKVREDETENIKHHMIDVYDVDSNIDVKKYQEDARKILNSLLLKNKNIIICGGTGLYIKALLYDYKFQEETLNNKYDNMSLEELQKFLPKDSLVDKNNKRRVVRFLEKLDNGIKSEKSNKLYDFYMIGLTKDREEIYNKINLRVDEMIKEGLIDEVKSLYAKYKNARSINSAIGYKEIILYLNNEISLEEAIEKIKLNTRRYAKRQYTFFNNQFDITWIKKDDKTLENILELLKM